MSASQPVELSALFTQTATAVVGAQTILDSRFGETLGVYSIPVVTVSARFEVVEDADHRIFFFFGSKTKQSTAHTLSFTLLASPDPPPAIGQTISTNVTLPAFIVDRDTRQHLLNILFFSLGLPDEVQCVFPDGGRLDDFSHEVDAICHALKNQNDDSIGLVFLRVTDDPEQFLVVRLGKHPEGIFLITPDNPQPLQVYSCLKAGNRVFYKPLELALQRFRDHLAGHARTRPAGTAVPDKFGPISVGPLANQVWSGYVAARMQLAESVTVPPSPYPIAFELRGVGLDMGYTVPLSGSQAPDSPFINSRVTLTVADRDTNPGVAIQLVSPEYLLTGEGRTALLGVLQQRLRNDILPNFNDVDDLRPYEDMFAKPDAQASAIVLLSYRNTTPLNEFLVVWTDGVSEFAFTAAWDNGVFKKVSLTFPLQSPGSVVLDPDPYVAFHNFLHAVRIWDLTGGWTLPVASTGCQ